MLITKTQLSTYYTQPALHIRQGQTLFINISTVPTTNTANLLLYLLISNNITMWRFFT